MVRPERTNPGRHSRRACTPAPSAARSNLRRHTYWVGHRRLPRLVAPSPQARGKHMSEGAATATRGAPTWPQLLWSGRGKPATRWRALIGGVLALALAWVSYALMLSTICWTMPLKLVGWALLLVTLALLFIGARALLRALLHMGIKRLLIRLGILYVLAIVLVAWLVPSGQTGIGHVLSSAGSIL